MSQENTTKYRVRFTGEMLPGFAQESAILSVAKAYGVPPEDIAKWFAPEGVTLRESAGKDDIASLEGFFAQHGLKLSITEIAPQTEMIRPQLDSMVDERSAEKLQEEHEDDRSRSQDYSARNEAQNSEQREVSLEDLQQTLSQLKVMLLPKDLENFKPASLLKRLGAYLIDFFLFVVLFQLILSNILAGLGLVDLSFLQEYVALFNESGGSLEQMLASPDIEVLASKILKSIGPWYVALYFLYFAVQERYYGATLGKRLFKIRIFSLRTGKNLTWNSIAVRTILFFLGLQFLTSIPLVGVFLFAGTMLWAIRDPLYRRTLYDVVSGTVVGSVSLDK